MNDCAWLDAYNAWANWLPTCEGEEPVNPYVETDAIRAQWWEWGKADAQRDFYDAD